jgi:hypothetical protein
MNAYRTMAECFCNHWLLHVTGTVFAIQIPLLVRDDILNIHFAMVKHLILLSLSLARCCLLGLWLSIVRHLGNRCKKVIDS